MLHDSSHLHCASIKPKPTLKDAKALECLELPRESASTAQTWLLGLQQVEIKGYCLPRCIAGLQVLRLRVEKREGILFGFGTTSSASAGLTNTLDFLNLGRIGLVDEAIH